MTLSFFSRLAFGFFFLLNASGFAQQIVETSSILQDAEIYSSGATLHHISEDVKIPKGLSELVINEIAQHVNPQSIRIGASHPNLTILSVTFEKDYLKTGENRSSQYQALKGQYEEAKALLHQMANARKAEETALSLLEANKDFGGDTGITPVKMTAMIKYYREEYQRLSNNIDKLKKKEKEQQKTTDRLKKQMNEAGGNGRHAGQLVVRLQADSPLSTAFDIHYFTPYVSWTPFYEVRVDDLNQPAHLIYKAKVSQSTGIDWKQVNLAFSSGNPRRNNNAPQLSPWWIGFGKDNLIYNKLHARQPGIQAETMEVVEEEVRTDMAEVHQGQLNTSFVVDTPYDIYTNKKPQAVQLKQYRLPATYTYFTAPRLDNAAFLVARISEWQQYNLLPGEANLIVDNTFAGSSFINPNITEEELTLSLGRDERITTHRERIEEEGSTSFFGTSKKRVYTYQISIRNSRKEDVAIEVKEQFPLSTEKDIEIKLLQTSGAQVDGNKGELTWNVDLKSGKTKKITVSYSIKAPKDKKIEGI